MKKRVLGMLLTGLVLGSSAAYVVHANPSVMGGSSVSAATYSKEFTDIAADFWAASQIADARGQGYIDGYADGSFQPNRKVSRVEFVKMAVVALHINVGSAGSDPWYKAYMEAAKKAGIYAEGDFLDDDLNASMTRAEMAKIAVRVTGQKTGEANKWMYLATKIGLITGLDDTGTLGEDQNTTRAQSVTIIERTLSIKSSQTLSADKHAVSRAEVSWHGTNIYTMLPRYFNPKFQDRFDISKAKWDSSDGNYHEELMSYIAVDIDDANDPFRNEIEGINYIYPSYENGIKGGQVDVAPKGAYVVFSKVKQVIKGKYPASLFVNYGGVVSMTQIVPNDAIGNKRADWLQFYAGQESTNQIYYSKGSDLNTLSQWHINKGLNPYYAKQFSNSGGTYYWISTQAIPKGDFFSFDNSNTVLRYTPNIAYMNNYGPKTYLTLLNGIADYTVSNP